MPIEILVPLGIFYGGMIVSHLLCGPALRLIEGYAKSK